MSYSKPIQGYFKSETTDRSKTPSKQVTTYDRDTIVVTPSLKAKTGNHSHGKIDEALEASSRSTGSLNAVSKASRLHTKRSNQTAQQNCIPVPSPKVPHRSDSASIDRHRRPQRHEAESITSSPRPKKSLTSRTKPASPEDLQLSREDTPSSSTNSSDHSRSSPRGSTPTEDYKNGASHGRRFVVAVAIPSVDHATQEENSPVSDFLPEIKPTARQHVVPTAVMSFSSILGDTETTVSTQTSSRRTIRNGRQIVTNSDSGSMDSDSGGSTCDELLEDVSTLIPYKRRRLMRPDDAVQPVTQSSQLSSPRVFSSSPSAPAPSYRHNLATLIAQKQSMLKAEARIVDLEKEIDEAKKRGEVDEVDAEHGQSTKHALTSMVGSRSEGDERVLQALTRVEALLEDEPYHFFLDQLPRFENTPFPISSLPADSIWRRLLADRNSWTSACLNGFTTELVTRCPLPLSATLWLAQQLTHERDQGLCEAYLSILRASIAHVQSISDTLTHLTSFYKTTSIFESDRTRHPTPCKPLGLPYIVRMLALTAPASDGLNHDAGPFHTSAALLDLALMSIDESVKRDPYLSMLILESIQNMLQCLDDPSYARLIVDVSNTLFEPSHLSLRQQCQLISFLPKATHRANRLRQILALRCLHSSSSYNFEAEGRDWAKCVVSALSAKPELQISETTNYSTLASLINIVDIAIDPAAEMSTSQSPALLPRPNPFTKPQEPTDAEKLHNQIVDAIVLRLQSMAGRIRDAGASQLRRTEAKSTIERVVARLEHSVRTRPKPRKSVFNSGSTLGKSSTSSFNRSKLLKKTAIIGR